MTNREIDALVELHIFKRTRDTRCRVCGWPLADDAYMGCVAESCSQRPSPVVNADEAAKYSTDPIASKQLRDKMRTDGWFFVAEDNPHGKGFWAQWRRWKPEFKVSQVTSTTEELAVALAALKAHGVEV